jgi:hypothetical protein
MSKLFAIAAHPDETETLIKLMQIQLVTVS